MAGCGGGRKGDVVSILKDLPPPKQEKWEWCWLGFHKWGKWYDKFEGSSFQHRVCLECGKKKERIIGW